MELSEFLDEDTFVLGVWETSFIPKTRSNRIMMPSYRSYMQTSLQGKQRQGVGQDQRELDWTKKFRVTFQCKALSGVFDLVAADIFVIFVRDIVVTCFNIIAALILSQMFIMLAAAGLEQVRHSYRSTYKDEDFEQRYVGQSDYYDLQGVYGATAKSTIGGTIMHRQELLPNLFSGLELRLNQISVYSSLFSKKKETRSRCED